MNEIGLHEEDWDKHFKLMADIDMSACTYTTALIAPDTNDIENSFQGIPFSGVFDGANHEILNLTIDTAGEGNDYLGLFGQIDAVGKVKNLGMENVSVTGVNDSEFLGGLCGRNLFSILDLNRDSVVNLIDFTLLQNCCIEIISDGEKLVGIKSVVSCECQEKWRLMPPHSITGLNMVVDRIVTQVIQLSQFPAFCPILVGIVSH